VGYTVAWSCTQLAGSLWGGGDEEVAAVTVREMNKIHSREESRLD